MSKDTETHALPTRVISKILSGLSEEELRRFFTLYQIAPQPSETASKAFMIGRIMEKVSTEELLMNRLLVIAMANQLDKLSSAFEEILVSLKQEDIMQICKKLGKDKLASTGTKSEIVERLVAEVPFSKVWKSKAFQKHLKPRPIPVTYVKRLGTDINNLSKKIEQMRQQFSEAREDDLRKTSDHIQRLLKEIGKVADQFEMGDDLLEDILRDFYEQSLEIRDPLSAEHIANAGRKMISKMNASKWKFVLKGLELMMLHYLLTHIGSLQWKPTFEDFMRVVREEIPQIQILPNQAEIPALRELISRRLGISDSTFDEQLIEAWKKGHIKLEVGAPIGRENVKYLKYGQSAFFYVKLLRG